MRQTRKIETKKTRAINEKTVLLKKGEEQHQYKILKNSHENQVTIHL
ncbi:MAG: hypothetical protein JETT_1073 [Candidatus Jettenia ecosi]|uniref:Uncharacterized protein n=1 Tax=Candidatus Jettenia ecosi TaxID=2494326 RepID=A0A533QDM2_9BACT|nr:MAG: hypothetical protein JETT_1073 [Candidatus Jettenia ecosi]